MAQPPLIYVAGSDPAAGAEFSVTVPGTTARTQYKIKSINVVCVQGATQTPIPRITIKKDIFNDDTTPYVVATFIGTSTIATSTTVAVTFAPGLSQAQNGATTAVMYNAPIPNDFIVEAGWTINSDTVGIGANTNYATPYVLLEQIS